MFSENRADYEIIFIEWKNMVEPDGLQMKI
jgi:hypothetical protein